MGSGVNLEQTQLGYEIRTPNITVFMGGVGAQLQDLARAYPQYQMMRLKQIHSDTVVESVAQSEDYQIQADSHFTKETNLALCVITADCVPIFFYEPEIGLISGVHAGWRGVASRIIPKTIRKLIDQGANPRKMTAIIGPHIQKQSFEVGNDVRDQILASLGPVNSSDPNLQCEAISNYSEVVSEQKSLVDLNLVVRTQLQHEGIELENVFDLHIDTVKNPLFHSYRRDKEKSGRQISFICRTS